MNKLTKEMMRWFVAVAAVAMLFAVDGGQQTAMAMDLQADDDEEIASLEEGPIVRRRLLYRSGRIEIEPKVSFTTNDALIRNVLPGIALNYYLNNTFGIGGSFGYGALHMDTSLKQSIEGTLSQDRLADTSYSQIGWAGDLGIIYVPLFGKFTIMNNIITHYDLHLFGGMYTFRAAAVDQLEIWAKRTAIPMHRGEEGADPSSVIYSGIEKGVKEEVDVIICDTAGRLHTNSNLLDELGKMERVAGKALDGAPHETLLVLDANTGQNAIAQAKLFREALDITGVVLTKLDGTAKGGVILGICDELEVPVRYVGIGEGLRDLRPFDAEEFVEALFM